MTLILAPRRQWQVCLCEFETVSLVFLVSFRPARSETLFYTYTIQFGQFECHRPWDIWMGIKSG